MRLNTTQNIARDVTVFLNGEKQTHAVEVYIPGNALEGDGYIVRDVVIDGKVVLAFLACKPLPPCRSEYQGALVEKVFGHIRIEITEAYSVFPGGEDLIPRQE